MRDGEQEMQGHWVQGALGRCAEAGLLCPRGIQDQPEVLRDKLEKFLGEQGVSYSYSGVSKFANFINRSLL